MSDILYPSGGVERPKWRLRLRCVLLHKQHYFMAPTEEARAWCGRCGLWEAQITVLIPANKPPAPPPPPVGVPKPLIIPFASLDAILEQVHPGHVSSLNDNIKSHITWLVDEYRRRKKIMPHVMLDDDQLYELVDGIVHVIEKYEGVKIRKNWDDYESEEDEDDNGGAIGGGRKWI